MKASVFLYICCVFGITFIDGVCGQACGSVLTEKSGQIRSEGYPNNYPSFHDCSWTIQADGNEIVTMRFRDFNVEPGESCEFDYLLVKTNDGEGRFCGDKLENVGNNGLLQVRGTTVLTLKSDDSVNLRGIDMLYEVTPDPNPTTTTPAPTTTPPPTTLPPATTTLPPGTTCDDEPCLNGADCTMDAGDVFCFCADGFEGQYCEINTNECLSEPCENGGTCVDGANSWSCNCVPGFIGETCGIDYNECRTEPCKNGATCEDLVNAFNCVCQVGWTDWDCGTEIDECDPNPCLNYGVCEDHVGSYSCVCHPKWTGTNCDTPVEEDPPPTTTSPQVTTTTSPPPPPTQPPTVPPENVAQQEPPPEVHPMDDDSTPLESSPSTNQQDDITAPEDDNSTVTPPLEDVVPSTEDSSSNEENQEDPVVPRNNTDVGTEDGENDRHEDGPPYGAIFGSVFAALAVIGILLGMFYYLKMVKNGSKIHDSPIPPEDVKAESGFLQKKSQAPAAPAGERETLKSPSEERKNDTRKKKFTKKRKDTRKKVARDIHVSSSVDSGITSRPPTSYKDAMTSGNSVATTDGSAVKIIDAMVPPREKDKVRKPKGEKKKHKNRERKIKDKLPPVSPPVTPATLPEASATPVAKPSVFATMNPPTSKPDFATAPFVTPSKPSFTPQKPPPMVLMPPEPAKLDTESIIPKQTTPLSLKSFQFQSTLPASTPTKTSFEFTPNFSFTPKSPHSPKRRKRKIAHRVLGPRPKTAAADPNPPKPFRNLPNISEVVSPPSEFAKHEDGYQLGFSGSNKPIPETTKPIFFSQILSKKKHSTQQPTTSGHSSPQSPTKEFNILQTPTQYPTSPRNRRQTPFTPQSHYNDPQNFPQGPTERPRTGHRTPSRRASSVHGTSTSISSVDDLFASRNPNSLENAAYPVVTHVPRPRSLAPLSRPSSFRGKFPNRQPHPMWLNPYTDQNPTDEPN